MEVRGALGGVLFLAGVRAPNTIKRRYKRSGAQKAWGIALFTDREFFGQYTISTPGYIRRRKKSSSKLIDPNKIQPGDYVVHRNHGIGQFIKIEKIALTGVVSPRFPKIRFLKQNRHHQDPSKSVPENPLTTTIIMQNPEHDDGDDDVWKSPWSS